MSLDDLTAPRPALAPEERLLNRELSWLDFNARVLALVEDSGVPLLERVRFCSIVSSALDEFFMVRVAGLLRQAGAGLGMRSPDGRTPQAALELARTSADVAELAAEAGHRCDQAHHADVTVAAVMAESAARSAAHLVSINLLIRPDDGRAAEAEQHTERARQAAAWLANER